MHHINEDFVIGPGIVQLKITMMTSKATYRHYKGSKQSDMEVLKPRKPKCLVHNQREQWLQIFGRVWHCEEPPSESCV